MTDTNAPVFRTEREPRIRYYAALVFTVLIAATGAVMMTVTSSPNMKGAAFLWLPAALQLLAGVWLGPRLGFLAGGLGAYAAGILAYGGWGPPDIIMNFVAGGFANAMLPAILFRVLRIDPEMGGMTAVRLRGGIFRVFLLLLLVIAIAIGTRNLNLGWMAYLPSILLLLIVLFVFRGRVGRQYSLTMGILVCIFISAVSAAIGCWGAVVAGQTWRAAFISVGVGWFFGDTVSSLLGLLMLAAFTERARQSGFAR